jgi:hypothetical protein
MQNDSNGFITQIECNTISIGAGNSADSVNRFFRHFSKKYPSIYQDIDPSNVPCEGEYIIDNIASAFDKALSIAYPKSSDGRLIIFIVLPNEKNLFDQYALMELLYDK